MNDIVKSIEIIREKIARAQAKSGRTERDVLLIGVTKKVDIERIRIAYDAGLRDFGENYVQEAKKKIESFNEKATWHMIGHIQTNKIKYIPKLFDYVHSVDRWEVVELLNRFEKKMKVLFEVNIAGEETKHGASPDELKKIIERIETLNFIEPVGLMTMAPFVEDPEEVRWVFKRTRELLEELNREFGLDMKELSMGMSNDFEVAIEEGATMVRIGTAIFGERI
ncbi:MAG: YggS family pyridoxal phosphate-dependent enzyme [Syntrophorhabdaceae bacterium]|nr:YggS family pyridoxal phosphate-dependent enzyme [Syntrophorhabdaceae bacterium]